MLQDKYNHLKEYLKSLGSVAIAYSSGVDSTFLLKVAVDTLGTDKVLAVTAVSGAFPKREYNESIEFCRQLGVRQELVTINEMEIEGFSENPVNRCYICKKAIFSELIRTAKNNQIAAVAEGSNMDDNGDYRPGLLAIRELDVKSPLQVAGLYKSEIRELSKGLSLPTFNKPSFACLASRFPYGETITREKLEMVDKAEQLLMDMGLTQFRVRTHGEKDFVARIELLPEDFSFLMDDARRNQIYTAFQEYGYSYVSLDLRGYRTGSMNETIQ